MRRNELLLVVNFGDAPTELLVDGDLDLLFRTPGRPTLAEGRLELPRHTGALLGPSSTRTGAQAG